MVRRYRRSHLSWILLLVASCILTSDAAAQPGSIFGKNKVQYRRFDWKFVQSPHLDVYFYEGGRELAEFTAEEAEKALESIQKTMRYDITSRISILVYNSHNDFQQTNAVGEYLPEGVGGVTELFKNRVVLPFEGSYDQYRHVLHHELVHAVVNDMFTGGSYQALLTGGGMQIPSWMNEGLAEYESLSGLDIETDMYMRDATLNNVVPSLVQLGGYVQYRVGQTMYWYISQKYGPEKVGELLHRIRASRDVNRGFRTTFGLSVEEFGERFLDALKKLYYPDIARYQSPREFAEIMSDHLKLENFINASPQVSPQGDLIAFISDRNDYYDVYVQSISRPQDVKRVLSGGGATANFEELHLLTPGLTWSPDGKRLALASKAGKYDAIFTIDVNSGEYVRLPNIELEAIQKISWSPDGKKLAFVGVFEGASDLYIYDIEAQRHENITRDLFAERDVTWTPDSKSLVFVSQRGDNLVPGEYPPSRLFEMKQLPKGRDLYRYDLEVNAIARISISDSIDEFSPTISNDNTLYYISNQNGVNNIWTSALDGSGARALTNSIAKIDEISISNDGSKLAFQSMHKGGYDIYLLRNPLDQRLSDTLPRTAYRSSLGGNLALIRDSIGIGTVGDTARGVGEVGIDLNDYVFSQDPNDHRGMRDFRVGQPLRPITNFKDTSGHYIVRDYKVVFSPDVIIGTAGYTGYYGLQGTTQMLFSDEIGNHQLFFATNLLLDLRNSDYLLAYYNLQNRVNWGLQGFHTANFLRVPFDRDNPNYIVFSRFTTFGLTGLSSYPFDRFNRLDLNFSALVLEKDLIVEQVVPTKRKYAVFPQLAFVHDNTLWSYFYPRGGTRYNINVTAAPKLGDDWLGFVTPSVDFRHYFKLSSEISLATRMAGSMSFGHTPQKSFIGGVDAWLNRFFSEEAYPLYEPEDFAFFNAGRPLRGYAYNEKIGTKYLMSNVELRYPFPVFVAGIPFSFFGDIFVDAGTAWTRSLYLFERKGDGKVVTRDLLLSTGTGIRTYLFGFYVHMDIAWKTNLESWSRPIYLFSIGEDF